MELLGRVRNPSTLLVVLEHTWKGADQGKTMARGGWRGSIAAQRGEETLGREVSN